MTAPRPLLLALAVLLGGPNLASAQSADVVRPGSPALRGKAPAVGSDTTDDFVLEGGARRPGGGTIRSIGRVSLRGEPAYVIDTRTWGAGGDTTVTSMTIRGTDLSLLSQRLHARTDSASLIVVQDRLTAWSVLPGASPVLLDLTLDHPVFGIESQLPWLLPLLPFHEGYRAAVPHFSPWTGGEKWDSITVVGSEPVTVNGRTFDCWKLDTGHVGPPGYRMYRWVDQRTRRILQSVLRGAAPGTEYWSVRRP